MPGTCEPEVSSGTDTGKWNEGGLSQINPTHALGPSQNTVAIRHLQGARSGGNTQTHRNQGIISK